MIALMRKARKNFRLYAARIRSMYRDAARFDISVEAERRPEQGDRAVDDEDNDDQDSGRGNTDVEGDVDSDVIEGEVAEGWPQL